MQSATCINDDTHIITASNSNKKLFFQGWKKSVEAFSQGKGSLSHRCSSILSQLDTSRLDEAISWSSSEEEEDKSNSQHIRPLRTLASQINFDDCKRVHSRGRRHSSAQFVRSVDKNFKGIEKEKNEVLCSLVRKSSSPNHSQDISINASESFDEPNWVNNLSILNKRIHLSLNPANSHSSDELIDDALIPSSCNGSQDCKVTSPILAKNLKRKKNLSFKQKRKTNELKSSGQSDLPPCSPVFKITKHRRRRSHIAPQKPSVASNCQTAASSCVPTSAPSSSSKNSSCLTSENTEVLTPSQIKNVSDIQLSPVLGKSTSKRRRPMIVDKLISPILGSKTKSSRPVKIQKLLPRNQLSNSAQESSNHFDLTLQENKCTSNLSTNADGENIYPISRSMSSENLASAKRSLDFSGTYADGTSLLINCDTNVNKTDTPGYPQTEFKKPTCDLRNDKIKNAQNVTLALAGSPMFGFSQFIEDVNTEQIEVACVLRSPRAPDHLPKKKKLSLSKKEVYKKKITSSGIKDSEPPTLSKENLEWQTFSGTGENHFPNNQKVDFPKDSRNQFVKNKQSFEETLLEPTKLTGNLTFLIEEENSEPIKFASQDVFLPPTCLKQNKASPDSLSFSFGSSNKIADKKYYVEDGGIDSCSSQSPENSQLTQIEKLPSSCVSSPVTISQTSSSTVPVVVSSLSAETIPDDFNAPPKKGKKKLNPDGLASRLQRVLNRHRSSSRIWQYKRSKDCKANCVTNVNMARTTSMALSINHVWVEYSHVIIQGCIEAEMSSGTISSCLNSASNHVILVLDPYIAVKLGKIMSAKKIRVFPPWQALKLQGISLILCAYCIEVIEVDSAKQSENVCVAGKAISVPVEGLESFLGAGACLPDIIFPKVVEKPTCSYQCTEANDDVDLNEGNEIPANSCTISALVTNYYVGTATCDTINLKILRVFQFREAESDQTCTIFASWSLLGQDSRGEICEVLLGNEQCSTSGRIWANLKTGHIIGAVMTLTGFVPVQRISPFRVSKLWRVVSNLSSVPCEQPVFYVLAASSSQWECKVLDPVKKFDNLKLHFTPLSEILMEMAASSTESTRVNIICRALHASYERLYVTDTEVSPRISVISVNPTAFLSPEVLKALVLVILDLEVVSGVLRVDKYSRITIFDSEDFCLTKDFYDAELFKCLAELNPTLPDLQKDSSSKSLTTFSGTITGVDEDSAFMWPACGICENELLSLGDNSEKYRCEKCNDQCDNFVLRMSLQVLCSCPCLPPNTSVRLKLLQKTIEKLLPPSLVGDEGYDMNSVLGQKLGPLRCEILSSTDQNFILQELPN